MRKKIGLMILIICTSILTASIAYGADLVISTAEELRAFATEVNGGNTYSGKTVELANDIDLKNVEFTPIGTYSNGFNGTFDGRGYKIKNLYISDESLEYVGLFGSVWSASIQNLTISGNITGGSSNVCVGGICGMGYTAIIENCTSDVTITSNAGYRIGGIVGNSAVDAKIFNCENRGNITVTSSGAAVGGISGVVDSYANNVIKECCNNGKIKNLSGTYTGGIIGWFPSDDYDDGIINCYNTGEIIGNTNVGGIVGMGENNRYITNVYNSGKITGTDASSTGGIVGTSNSNVTYAYNTGIVNDGAGYGICASNSGTITNAYYLSGTASAGVGGTEVATAKTSAELKSDEMVTLLIGTQTDALWVKDTNDINNGYPIFSYQVIDTLAPTGTISLGSTYYEANGYKYVKSNKVTINLTASDNVSEQSNIKVALINEKDYSRTNANSSITWLDFSSSVQWQASSGKGLKRVYVIFKDEAGNQSVCFAT